MVLLEKVLGGLKKTRVITSVPLFASYWHIMMLFQAALSTLSLLHHHRLLLSELQA